jgi:hypothetical protein
MLKFVPETLRDVATLIGKPKKLSVRVRTDIIEALTDAADLVEAEIKRGEVKVQD